MPTAKEYKPGEKIFALHISRSGDGKSAAAASYPAPYHQYDFDNRFDGVWGALKENGGFIETDGSLITFKRMYTKEGYEPFNDELVKLESANLSGRFPFKSIEIASATNMVQCLMNSSHELQKGKFIGRLRMPGPSDFNFETVGLKQIIDFLQKLPCHVIVSAHIVDKWGKPPGGDQYAQNQPIGEKLLLRDQTGENILTYFSNVFRFSREADGNTMKYYVEFSTDVAKNAFGIPPGRHDITGKPFFPYLQNVIKQIKEGTFEPPKIKSTGLFM